MYAQANRWLSIKRLSPTLAAVVLAVVLSGRAEAQSLPSGPWEIHANGHRGELRINSVNQDGTCMATVFGDQTICFWDGTAQRITFLRANPDPSVVQVYTGYMFSELFEDFYLTGYFEAFPGSGATARRSVFGWFAKTKQIP
jgi:hypothetical protein